MLAEKKGKIYMKKKKAKLPNFDKMTYQEEAHFWDTHSVTDFEDETEEIEIVFELNQPRDEMIMVRMQKHIKDRIEKIARSKGVNLSTLVRMWLLEKVQSANS